MGHWWIDLERQRKLNDLYNSTDKNCISQLRMRKDVFWKLSAHLRDAKLVRDSVHVSVEEKLAIFLHTVGHNLRNRVVGFFLTRSSYTDCIGALDGTHIPAFVPENIANRFRGRKSYPTQNVLAVVDFDLRFTYVLAGWEGSTHDSEVLKAALNRTNGIPMPEGKYYLADAGYAARPVHKMDEAERNMSSKGKECKGDKNASAKAINWPIAISEFLLDWYIEKKIEMPPKAVFKKMHHNACTSAINEKYGCSYSVQQVHCHFRCHKETWGQVARYSNESGSGFDDVNKQVLLSQSTLDTLSFYDKLKELFSGSSADGSFMQDPFSAAETDNDDKAKDDMMNDMSTYDEAKGPTGHDSDKLDTDSDDCEAVAALAATNSQVSSSNVGALKPNKKSFKKTTKANTLPPPQNDKAKKSKARSSQASQDDTDMDVLLTSTLIGIRETLASPVQTVAPKDPNAPLWDMLKKIPLPPDERMSVRMHLCKPEFVVHRGFLVSMGRECLERWVYTYLSDNDPTGKRGGDGPAGNLGDDGPAGDLGDDAAVNSSTF
ncbi:hypothetical protein VPH35_038999 [Triticum aestivum]